jgi:hypothetical protein
MGELVFFMSQPVAISTEDFVRWCWKHRRSRGLGTDRKGTMEGAYVGYVWVVVWFSASLPVYVKRCKDASIVRDAVLGSRPFEVGSYLASFLV